MVNTLYRKALRCTFFGEWKNSCSSKFVQLKLLNKAIARTWKNRAAQGFYYINSCISKIFGPYSKTCIVKVRVAWGRVSQGQDAQKWISITLKLDKHKESERIFTQCGLPSACHQPLELVFYRATKTTLLHKYTTVTCLPIVYYSRETKYSHDTVVM